MSGTDTVRSTLELKGAWYRDMREIEDGVTAPVRRSNRHVDWYTAFGRPMPDGEEEEEVSGGKRR
eukprot:2417211-Rhodomonas_salina.3